MLAALPSASTDTEARRDAALGDKIARLASRSQADWGIPPGQQSLVLAYREAAFQLRGVEQYFTPSRRLLAVLTAAKAIFGEYAVLCESRARQVSSDAPPGSAPLQTAAAAAATAAAAAVLGADDLVPIFIFVLCQSGLRTPLRDKELLWALCHPDQLYGEAGYYLTVYESAVAYVEAFEET